MNPRPRMFSHSLVFPVLMVLAAALSLLPASWTSWKRGLVQGLGLPQWALSAAVRDVREMTGAATMPSITREQLDRLQRENEELRRLVSGQAAWLGDLERRFDEASGIRAQLRELGGEILIAPVLGFDSSPRRDTLLIGRGSVDKVRRGLWVAAGASPAERDPGETGRQLVLRQWLIGRVAEVQTYVSRVILASDPKFGEPRAGEPVCLARVLKDGRWQPTPPKHLLAGRGRGRMVISRADADYREQGYDVVLVPVSLELPVMLSIGRIVSSRRLEESALHFDLEVEPWNDPHGLRYVYVIVPGP